MRSAFNDNNSPNCKFCPLCQAPLFRLKVSSTFHIANCSVSWEALDECPDQSNCSSDNIFHYRDYAHSQLAKYRCSNLYVEEEIDISLEKQKKTPSARKSPKKSPKNPLRKKKIVSKNVQRQTVKSIEVIEVSDDDEDLSIFKPKKNGCNLVSKRKLYKSNSDISLAGITCENKKICTEESRSRKPLKTNKSIMLKSLETSNCSEPENNFHTTSSDTPSKISIKKECDLQTSPDGKDLNINLNTETVDAIHHRIDSSDVCEKESVETSISSKFVMKIPRMKGNLSKKEDTKKFSLAASEDTNSKSKTEIVRERFSACDELTDRSSPVKNAVDDVSDLLEKVPFSDDSHTKEEEKRNENSKNKSNEQQAGLKFFAPFNIKAANKCTNRKQSPKTPSVITYSNVKTILPGDGEDPNSDTTIVVDAFQYGLIPGVQSYFLTHFHSDHYVGLKKSFSQPIYCSQITANLVKLRIGVNEKYLNVINLNERTVVNGVEVVALDANHCPGSLMLLFQLRNGQNYLHVGDFRANPEMELYPELNQLRIHKLFLDTTYCKPVYTFPSQKTVVEDVLKITRDELMMNPRTLIVVGSYLIGKEKVFTAIAEEFNCRIWAEPSKMKIFDCIEDMQLKKRVTSEPTQAQVHVVPMMQIGIHKLKEYIRPYFRVFTRVVAFRPTGWCHNNDSNSGFRRLEYENVLIYEVPYSEHSSYSELQRFVQFTRPDNVIPTVNLNENNLKEMNKHFKMWLSEANQATILDYVKAKNGRLCFKFLT